MELYHLEAFESVITHRSFTRAAEALHLTQPAVTRQIASLEAELKTCLFDRLGRRVHLTSAGEALHIYAETIVRLSREARHAVADIGSGVAGRLTIGASSTLATYVLPPILHRFREAHPSVELAVHTGISADIMEQVRANDVDLGLVTADASDPLIISRPLREYETCAVVQRGHRLSGHESVTAAELTGSPLILMESGTNLRTYVDRLLSAAGVEEQVTMEMDNVEAIKRMIEAGLGISMLPRVAVMDEVAAGRLIALRLRNVPQASRHIRLIRRHDKYVNAAMSAVMRIVETMLVV